MEAWPKYYRLIYTVMNILKRLTGPRTVANDLMFRLVLTILPTICIVGVFYYYYTTQNLLSALSQRAEVTAGEIVQVLSPQLFYMDNKAVKHTSEVFLASGRLSGIQIISESGGTIIDKPSTDESLIPPRELSIIYNGYKLGKMRLWFSDREIRDSQKQTIILVLSVMAAIIVVIILSIHLALQSVLMKPLTLIKSRIEELTSGSFEGELPSVPQYNLNLIMIAVNNMASQLSEKTSQLAESEEKYREIFNATGDAIFIHDASTGDILEVNNTMLQMYGYDDNEESRPSIGDLSSGVKPYTAQDAASWVKRAVHEGPQVFEWEARRKDGECFWAEVVLQRTCIGGEGKILAVVRNISDRKESEKELLREKIFSEAIINSLPSVFYVYDENMRLIQWNRDHETISGFTGDELQGKYVLDWFDEIEKLRVQKKLQSISKQGKADIETYMTVKDGSKLPFYLSACMVKIENKKLLIGIGIDISEKKKVEEELRQAQKMEAIGTLAGGIAHDFNNILTVMSGNAELALFELKDDSPEIKEKLTEVLNSVQRAKDLVQQILTFSRKTDNELKPMQLSYLLKESIKMLRSMIPSTIEIQQDISSRDTILADPTQMHQVIINLCTNAYYAMLETGGVLTISLKTVAINDEDYIVALKAGQYLQLKVSDNGPGMSKEILAKIFEPYFTTKEKGKGTGLGLAVVHGIVQSHNGHIAVHSEPGQGTTFNVYFPVIEQEQQEIESGEHDEPLHGGGEHIMFVDDEEAIAKLSQDMLQQYGYKVTTFGNGVQALQEFKDNPNEYDLVITDMTMPYMNGVEFAGELMQINPEIPVILCTGHSELISRSKALAMGIKAFCEKPLLLHDLIRTAGRALDIR